MKRATHIHVFRLVVELVGGKEGMWGMGSRPPSMRRTGPPPRSLGLALYEARRNPNPISRLKVKIKVPILVVERRGPELIPDSRQSACR